MLINKSVDCSHVVGIAFTLVLHLQVKCSDVVLLLSLAQRIETEEFLGVSFLKLTY